MCYSFCTMLTVICTSPRWKKQRYCVNSTFRRRKCLRRRVPSKATDITCQTLSCTEDFLTYRNVARNSVCVCVLLTLLMQLFSARDRWVAECWTIMRVADDNVYFTNKLTCFCLLINSVLLMRCCVLMDQDGSLCSHFIRVAMHNLIAVATDQCMHCCPMMLVSKTELVISQVRYFLVFYWAKKMTFSSLWSVFGHGHQADVTPAKLLKWAVSSEVFFGTCIGLKCHWKQKHICNAEIAVTAMTFNRSLFVIYRVVCRVHLSAERKQRASSVRRNLGYPMAMLLLLFLTVCMPSFCLSRLWRVTLTSVHLPSLSTLFLLSG